MSEPEKPKRRYRQIHLSTLLLLLVQSGILLPLNIRAFGLSFKPSISKVFVCVEYESGPMTPLGCIVLDIVVLDGTILLFEYFARRQEGLRRREGRKT